MKKLILLSLPIALITSCTLPKYIAPSQGETATMWLVTESSSWKLFEGTFTESVSFAVKGEDGCGSINKQIEPESENDKKVKVKIPSNKEIFVTYFSRKGDISCLVTASFYAKTNKTYEVVNQIDGSTCNIGVVKINSEGKRISQTLGNAYVTAFGGNICSSD